MKNHAHQRRDPRPISELAIHKATVQVLRLFAAPGVIWFHIPNGEARSRETAAKLKAMGVLAGAGDLIILIPGRPSFNPWPMTCFMEFKTEKGRLSQAQRAFRNDVEKLGCSYALPRSVEEALTILHDWQAITRNPLAAAQPAKRAA
jgi:hypothetical protein